MISFLFKLLQKRLLENSLQNLLSTGHRGSVEVATSRKSPCWEGLKKPEGFRFKGLLQYSYTIKILAQDSPVSFLSEKKKKGVCVCVCWG